MSTQGKLICAGAAITALVAVGGIILGKTDPVWMAIIIVQSASIVFGQLTIKSLERRQTP